MSIHITAILKITILGALLGLLVVSYFLERRSTPRMRRRLDEAFCVVAVLAALGYYNFGHFRGFGPRLVHRHEQFHFYFGAKYLDELRYDGIYLATGLAAREDGDNVTRWKIRDPMTFRSSFMGQSWDRAQEIKARFSPERWEAFKYDRRVFFDQLGLPRAALNDHGNTGSPAWAALASLFCRPFSPNLVAATAFALVDQALLLILFLVIRRCFGTRVACIAIVFGLLPPKVFNYLGGSLLRLDWLFALGMSACCLKVGRHRASGAFLGYAVASKLFSGIVALALGFKFLIETVRTRRIHREQVELVLSAVATLGASVALSSLVFGGFEIWADFWRRLLVTLHEQHFWTNHSLRDLCIQAAHYGTEVFDWTPPRIATATSRFAAHGYPIPLAVARLVLVSGFLFVLARHKTIFAYGVGVLFVFVLLVTNMYYWQMLLLVALGCAARYREDARNFAYLLFLCVFLIAEYVFALYPDWLKWQGYFGSYWLALFCIFIFVVEIGSAAWTRLRRRQPAGGV